MARKKSSSAQVPPRKRDASTLPDLRPALPLRVGSQIQLQVGSSAVIDVHGSYPHAHQERPEFREQLNASLTTATSPRSSNSEANLARDRRLSVPLTPTLSEASNSRYVTTGSIASTQMLGYGPGSSKRQKILVTDNRPAGIEETLAGQGQWLPEGADTSREVEMVAAPLPPRPPENDFDSTSPWSPLKNQGGRKGGLSKEQAAHASAMRKRGACLRCHMFRIKCGEGDPCAQCRRKSRNWKLGCTRDWLEDRSGILMPEVVLRKLTWPSACNFAMANALHWLGEPFHMPLTQYLHHRKMYIYVRVVSPVNMERLQDRAFMSTEQNGKFEYQRAKLTCVPIIPYFKDDKPETLTEFKEEVETTTFMWLEGVLTGPNWDWHFFSQRGHLWERDMLDKICRHFQHDNETHNGLKLALKLTFLIHLLTHPFSIHKDDIPNVSKKLEEAGLQGITVPTGEEEAEVDEEETEVDAPGVTAFLHAFLSPHFQKIATETLKDLGALLTARGNVISTTEIAFCVAFLCIIVLAKCQISVLMSCSDPEEGENTFTKQQATQEIQRMENELARQIIELCVCRFRKQAKFKKVHDPAASSLSPFFESLMKVTDYYGSAIDIPTDLAEIDDSTFGAINVRRLSKKLYNAVRGFLGKTDVTDFDETEST